MSKRKMFFRMVTASILRRRSKIVIALLAIAIGATILSGLVAVYQDVPRQMEAQFRSYGANMILMPTDQSFTQADVDAAVACIPAEDVVGVAAYRYENVRINDTPVVAAGTDMEGAQATSPYFHVEGAWPSKDGQLLVGANVAETYALKVDDFITVSFTPAGALESQEVIADNYKSFQITGILDTGGSEEDYIYMSMADLDSLTEGESSVDMAELSISASSSKLSQYAEEISQAVPAVDARLVKRVAESEATVLGRLQSLVLIVTVIVLALTMITVATTMMAVVQERRQEIGLRKALGASNKSIVSEFMGEGMLLGAVGGLIGGFLGYGFALMVSMSVFNSTLAFNGLLVVLSVIVSVLVTGLACLIPIRNATQVDPAIVLRGE